MNIPPSRFIVVEDQDEDAFILRQLLDRSGVTGATLFRTAEIAVDAMTTWAAKEDPAALPIAAFIDVGLPRTSGDELLRWIRSHELLRTMAVVLLASSDEPRNLGKAMQLGADAYLVKFPSVTAMRDIVAGINRMVPQPLPRSILPVTCNLLLSGVSMPEKLKC